MIPLSPTWCVRCRNPKAYGLNGPCEHHRGANGEAVPYTGYEVYHPSTWVTQVVGSEYKDTEGRLFRCEGYDPRSGFFMKNESEEKCVSERAIDRTFHRVRE